jgi:hypothetical protein
MRAEPRAVPMSAILACPICSARLKVPSKLLGRWISCPKCGERFAAVDDEQPQGADYELSPPPRQLPQLIEEVPNASLGYELLPDPPTRPLAADPSEPTVRCYDCGQRIPESEAIRRDVKVGSSPEGGWVAGVAGPQGAGLAREVAGRVIAQVPCRGRNGKATMEGLISVWSAIPGAMRTRERL